MPGSAAARAHRPPMPSSMSGNDNSIAENLPPPPNLGRGRLIAPFRIDANAPNQNSAGKYPLISRPTQISTRVGVVQAMVYSFARRPWLGRVSGGTRLSALRPLIQSISTIPFGYGADVRGVQPRTGCRSFTIDGKCARQIGRCPIVGHGLVGPTECCRKGTSERVSGDSG